MPIATGNRAPAESWTAGTLENSFTALASNTPGYMKDGDNIVYLRGRAVKASPSADETIFTLPAGYRPKQAINAPAVGNVGAADVFGAVLIGTDGTVKYRAGGASTSFSLDGISFRADY